MLDRIAQFRQTFQTRKTEQNDTRQDIQRHDPDHHKKKNDDEEGGFKDPYDDLTDVSVAALITFLEGLLDQSDAPSSASKSDAETADTDIHQEYRRPIDKAHAVAMNAYGARGATTHITPPPQQSADDKPKTALDQAASALDQSAVKSTIRDLRGLLSRGIDHIALERGNGFLESIQNTVEKY
ncbi:MAG: hypothetical protein COB76_00230 [Alphaproteobacteria bacterium]|nr:MAG: hypothetical protein COB76_00230 [Alphaproteobacteria bacterium]